MVCTEWSSFLPAVLGTAQAAQKQSPISAVVSFLPMFVGIMLIFYFCLLYTSEAETVSRGMLSASID